jgi:hypothetical protein
MAEAKCPVPLPTSSRLPFLARYFSQQVFLLIDRKISDKPINAIDQSFRGIGMGNIIFGFIIGADTCF